MGERSGSRHKDSENLYQRNGIFYARAQVGKREHRKSLQTSDRREAQRRLKRWLAELSPYHGTERHTYKEAVALWFKANAGQWKPGTEKRYGQSLAVLDAHFGDMFWDQVDKYALMAFVEKRKAAGRKVATINRDLTVISGIAKHVRELRGWPDDNPVDRVPKKPRKERRLPYIRPPAEDIEAYFERMPGTFGDLCRFALLTGARMNEIVTIGWAAAQAGNVTFHDTKNRLPRTIALNDEARAIVVKQPRPKDAGPLFTTRNGGAYKRVTEMFREIVNRAQEMAQRDGRTLTRMRFHDLRHEFAIRYLENGGNLYRLSKLLGHGSIRQTEWYLAYLTPEQADKAQREVGTQAGSPTGVSA